MQAKQELFNVRDSAAYMGIAQPTLWTWIYARRIPSIRLGRAVRLRKSDLDNFIESNVTPALEPRQ
jgi:excisionase family DNA binding protein